MIGVVAAVSIFAPADLALAIRKALATDGFVIMVFLTPFGAAVPAGGGGGPGGGCPGSIAKSSCCVGAM